MRFEKTTLLAVLLLVTPIALLPAVYASPPVPIAGTIATLSADVVDCPRGAGVSTVCVQEMLLVSGDQSGVDDCAVERERINPNAFTDRGTCVFTGTVLGSAPGTAIVRFTLTFVFSTGRFQGNFIIGQGTGGLAGVHAEGSFFADNTYEGVAHFDP